MYGILLMDHFLFIPSGIGFILGVFQLILKYVHNKKEIISITPKNEKNQQEEK